jgi:hypothetical protein
MSMPLCSRQPGGNLALSDHARNVARAGSDAEWDQIEAQLLAAVQRGYALNLLVGLGVGFLLGTTAAWAVISLIALGRAL